MNNIHDWLKQFRCVHFKSIKIIPYCSYNMIIMLNVIKILGLLHQGNVDHFTHPNLYIGWKKHSNQNDTCR